MRTMPDIKRFTIVTGHYGCGKTNLAINLALGMTSRYSEVTLVDLDIVNPYFRSSDYAAMLERHGVRVVSPTFAGTTLETPSLPAAISGALESSGGVILDVGGDDAGATALGRYAGEIARMDYDMLYVINSYRNLTATPEEAAEVLAEIEAASHLHATGVVNNSHLRTETTLQTVLDSAKYARETADRVGLPLAFTAVPLTAADQISNVPGSPTYVMNAYPVQIYVRFPWERPAGEDGKA